MSGVICGLSRTIITICDVVNVMEALSREPTQSGEVKPERISNIIRLGIIALGGSEALVASKGGTTKTLKQIKGGELFLRIFHLAFRAGEVVIVEKPNPIEVVEKGIIAQISDLIRTGAELDAYQERMYLEHARENPEATRPIYEMDDSDPESPVWNIVGYRVIDPEECEAAIADRTAIAQKATVARVAAEIGLLQKTVQATQSVYCGLNNWLSGQSLELQGSGAFDHEQTSELPTIKEFNLTMLQEIPEPFHGDEVFSKYICPITSQPIRDPVADPTTGNSVVLYERSAILNALTQSRRSPITRQPLMPSQLLERPALRALIDARLQYHDDQFWSYVQQSTNLQERLTIPADAALQENANRENPNV